MFTFNVALKREDNIIHLTYKDIVMIKKEIIYRNPLVNLGYDNEDILPAGGFGAVLAHAGVGKTALLVQLALNMMLRGNSILHVSLNDAVGKVDLWYQEIFHDIAEKFGIVEVTEYWDRIQPYRFIMTFKVEGFSAPKLEERLNDLMEQNIFKPHTIIIDGFRFDDAERGQLMRLKELVNKYSMRMWFTVHTHRHEPPQENGLPLSFLHIADLFDAIVQLAAKGDEVYIKSLKGISIESKQNDLILDPATMLIKDSE